MFIEKVRDVVGLYLNPPERALVLSVEEKSQIQALGRWVPILPLMPLNEVVQPPERCTHDYTRHGTTSLFTALDTATGKIIGKCYNRHRAQEFKEFLAEIEANVPEDMDIHIIMDNHATHKTPAIRNWLARRPHWHVHFTPTTAFVGLRLLRKRSRSLAQHGRTLLCRNYRKTDQARCPSQRQATHRRDHELYQQTKR